MTRNKPTRSQQKATRAAKHHALHVIMREPDDVVHFPVAFGKIALNFVVVTAVVLGLLALAVLSSTVFLMRDELRALAGQLKSKDADLGALSVELGKVRDQMFGEAAQPSSEQGITVQRVDADTGLLTSMGSVVLKDTNYPLGPAARAVSGKYLYWTDEEGIVRVNLEDGTSVRLVKKPFISSIAVSKDGAWLGYAFSQGLSDPESVGTTQAVAMPLTGRGDAIELGEIEGGVPAAVGFSANGKEFLWTTFSPEGIAGGWTLHRRTIANGVTAEPVTVADSGTKTFLGFSSDGASAVTLEGRRNDSNEFVPGSVVVTETANGRRRVRYTFGSTLRTNVTMDGWSIDGSAAVLSWDGKTHALALQGNSAPKTLVDSLPDEERAAWAVAPEKFVLAVAPGIAGRYLYWNLATGAVSSADGPFTGIAGWSADLNAVVLLSDTRE